jgi:hypothetical protein
MLIKDAGNPYPASFFIGFIPHNFTSAGKYFSIFPANQQINYKAPDKIPI